MKTNVFLGESSTERESHYIHEWMNEMSAKMNESSGALRSIALRRWSSRSLSLSRRGAFLYNFYLIFCKKKTIIAHIKNEI